MNRIDRLKEMQAKARLLGSCMDERSRRLWAACEAMHYGRGGVVTLAEITGLAESTIRCGIRELHNPAETPCGRIRRAGGGRKSLLDRHPELLSQLDTLIEPESVPEEPSLRWTWKSTRRLASEMAERGYPLSHSKVAQLLQHLGYYLPTTSLAMRPEKVAALKQTMQALTENVHDRYANCHPVVMLDVFSSGGVEPSGASIIAVSCLEQWWDRYAQKLHSTDANVLLLIDNTWADAILNRWHSHGPWDVQTVPSCTRKLNGFVTSASYEVRGISEQASSSLRIVFHLLAPGTRDVTGTTR